jgi:hypothetical protein
MFSANFTIPAVSFAAALWGTPEQNKRNSIRQEDVPDSDKHEGMKKEERH